MKNKNSLLEIAGTPFKCTLLLTPILGGLMLPLVVSAQTYSFAVPSSPGGSELPFSDTLALASQTGGSGKWYGTSSSLTLGAGNGKLVYNSAANSMQFLGNLTVTGASGTANFNTVQTVNGNNLSASVSLNYAVGGVNNGVMSFDTGAAVANPFGMWNLSVPIPISGSYSIIAGGQDYAGTFSYVLDLPVNMRLLQPATPTTLVFDQFDGYGAGGAAFSLGGPAIADVTTANGMDIMLAAVDPSDGATYQQWSLDPSATSVVPEPGTSAIFGCGLLGMVLLGRRKMQRA